MVLTTYEDVYGPGQGPRFKRDLETIKNGFIPNLEWQDEDGLPLQEHGYGANLAVPLAKQIFRERVILSVEDLEETMNKTPGRYFVDYEIDDRKLKKVCNDYGWRFQDTVHVLEEDPSLALKKSIFMPN